jgi:hypothetical protein
MQIYYEYNKQNVSLFFWYMYAVLKKLRTLTRKMPLKRKSENAGGYHGVKRAILKQQTCTSLEDAEEIVGTPDRTFWQEEQARRRPLKRKNKDAGCSPGVKRARLEQLTRLSLEDDDVMVINVDEDLVREMELSLCSSFNNIFQLFFPQQLEKYVCQFTTGKITATDEEYNINFGLNADLL